MLKKSNILDLSEAFEKTKTLIQNRKNLELRTLANWVDGGINERGKQIYLPKESRAIWDSLDNSYKKNIYNLRGAPFIITKHGTYITDCAVKFFSALHQLNIATHWVEGPAFPTKAEFFSFVGSIIEPRWSTVLEEPHYPKIPDVFYIKELESKKTGALQELMQFFSPADGYEELLKAAFVTPFWGGFPGSRPAFVFDGLDDDVGKSRNIGKSTITDAIAVLCGGHIELSASMAIEDAAKKIVNSDVNRIVRLDNIKKLKLSSEAIESLITAQHISAHILYLGTTRVPNYYTYYLTFNGANLSKDLATRCVVVRLARPQKDPTWQERCWDFIRKHRDAIIADIGYELSKEQPNIEKTVTRFPAWEKQVLGRISMSFEKNQAFIEKGEKETDDDERLSDEFREMLLNNIGRFRRDGVFDGSDAKQLVNNFVAIRKGVLASWVTEHIGKMSIRSASIMFAKNRPAQVHKTTVVYEGHEYWIWLPSEQAIIPANGSAYVIADTHPRERIRETIPIHQLGELSPKLSTETW